MINNACGFKFGFLSACYFYFFEALSAAPAARKLASAVSQDPELNCNLFLINLSTLPATKDHDNKFTEI